MKIIDHIGKSENIAVSVRCTTYNHAPYIRETLDSFVHQKTNFPFEIVIHDDASTDGTREIIEEYAQRYPHLIRAILQDENQYSQGISIMQRHILPMVNGKYLALCEGDDNWADMNKLQIQFDFLENQPEYSATCGVTRYCDDDNHAVLAPIPSKEFIEKDLTEENFLNDPNSNVGSNTLMFKTDYMRMDTYIRAAEKSPRVGDIILILHLFSQGKIYVHKNLFQNHRIQTRQNASNYNSIYSKEEKLEHSINVCVAVEEYLEGTHDLSKWINRQMVALAYDCIKEGSVDALKRCVNKLPDKYKTPVWLLILKDIPSFMKRKLAGRRDQAQEG